MAANVDLGLINSCEARVNQTQVNISPPKFFVGLACATRTKFPLPNWGSCLCTFWGGGSGPSVNRCEIGEKRCEIGQEIILPKSANLGKKGARLGKNFGERLDKN